MASDDDRQPVDRQSFDRLVVDHLVAAQRFAMRLTGNAEAAEEVVQEALVRAARSRSTFAGRARFKTWLFQIVVNAFRDRLSERASRILPESLPDGLSDGRARDPAAQAQAAEQGRVIASMVSALPARQREVLVLHAYEGLSTVEVAAVLGVSEQNVRTNLHLARRRLRELLAPYLPELPQRNRGN